MARLGLSSTSTEAILNSSLSSSNMIPTIWQGPHQVALKSTKTRPLAFKISVSKFSSVIFLIVMTILYRITLALWYHIDMEEYDIIIVGAGPAGLTAAIYARRASKKVLVFEAKSYGGQIINTLNIENYPTYEHISGVDFATKLYKQAKELGAEIEFEKVINIRVEDEKKIVKTEENEYSARAVILTNGSEERKLGLENEDALVGKGVSYCATCDGAFYKGKKVMVVGGGNTALWDALYLSDVAEKVYLVHRRNEFRGDDVLVQRLKTKNNVELVLNSNVTKLNAGEKLESVEVTSSDGEIRNIEVDGLFVAIGREPKTKDLAEFIELDSGGYVVAGENCHTNTPGIFVAGDSRAKEVRQLVTATSDGAVAAEEAVKYLNN